MSQATEDRSGPGTRRLFYRAGAYGAASWVTGYALSVVLFWGLTIESIDVPNVDIEFVLAELPPWILGAYLFYGGHLVSVALAAGTRTYVNPAVHADVWVTAAAILIPALASTLAGYLLSRQRRPSSLRGARLCGASVALGYAVLMVGGAFLFGHTLTLESGTHWTVTLHLPRAIVFGVAHPAVFGGIGGNLWHATAGQP